MRKLFIFLTICLTVLGTFGVWYVYEGYRTGEKEYTDLSRHYIKVDPQPAQTETEEHDDKKDIIEQQFDNHNDDMNIVIPDDAPPASQIDFTGLQGINPDVVGWIEIPAIEVSYPVLQANDNEYYLHRDIYQQYLFAGSIFLDCQNGPFFEDMNSIIYGHNMRDGSMFTRLADLNTPEVMNSCSYFWIYTETENHLYRIISVKHTANESSCYRLRFADDSEYQNWILEMMRSSETDCSGYSEITGTQSKTVTLSTCTENDLVKQVVQGIEIAAVSGESH